MKKKALHNIKQLAESLPQSFYETGNEHDVLKVNSTSSKIVGVALINHQRRLKIAFKQAGEKGLYDYIDKAFAHHKKMLEKYRDLLIPTPTSAPTTLIAE